MDRTLIARLALIVALAAPVARAEDRPSAPPFEVAAEGRRLTIKVDGRACLTYVPDDGPKPYYYPLIGPGGRRVTRGFPMAKGEGEKVDHPHQRSMWLTHGSVNGVDFWTELPGRGRIVESGKPAVEVDADGATIRTADDWVGPDGAKVCEDSRTVRVSRRPAGIAVDFDASIRASEGPLAFGDTKEGTFGLRVASSMDVDARKGGRIVNAEGLADAEAWGKASRWVDYSGPVGDGVAGVAVLDHPSSFRHPTTWHVRTYGLFAANPFGWHDFGRKESGTHTVPKGDSIRLRYRLILHDGPADPARLAAEFAAFADLK